MSRLILLASAIVLAATAAQAQTQPSGAVLASAAGPPSGWSASLGAGAIRTPDFRGASSYRVLPIPALIVRHGDDFLLSGLEASYTPFRSGPWSAGAQGRFRFGQKEGDNPVALRGLGGVGASVELGGFVGYSAGPLSFRASVAQDVVGGHGGQLATLGAAYSAVLKRSSAGPVRLGAGPSVTWASAKFNRSYYGVDARQAALSGLASYRPGSGLESVGLSANLVAPLNRKLTFVAIAGYDRLVDRAADSPRVLQRGSRDQATIGAFLTYRLR